MLGKTGLFRQYILQVSIKFIGKSGVAVNVTARNVCVTLWSAQRHGELPDLVE
jgi:hypothetical protein